MTDAPTPRPNGTRSLLEGFAIGCIWLVAGLGIYGAVRTIHQLKSELAQRTIDVEVETVQLLNQNKHLQMKLDDFQQQIAQLTQERHTAIDQGKTLMTELTKARESVSGMTTNLTELQQAHDGLIQEKVALTEQLAQFKASQQQWQDTQQATAQEMAQLRQEMAPVEHVRKNLQGALEDERKQRERERLAYEADLRALQRQMQEAKQDHERVEAMLDKTRHQLHEFTVDSQKERAVGDLSVAAYKRLSEEMQAKLRETSGKLSTSLRRQHSLEEDNASMHYNLARLFTENQKYDLAASEYLKVLEIKPDDADSHYNLAVLYDNYLNQRQKAVGHYRQYLKIQPSAKDAALIEGIILSLEAQDRIGE